MNTVYHIRRIKSKCHVIVSMGEEKAFDKIQHSLMKMKEKKRRKENLHEIGNSLSSICSIPTKDMLFLATQPVTKNDRDTRAWPFLSIVRLISEENFAQEFPFSRSKTFLKLSHSLRLLLSNPFFPFSDHRC